MERSEIVFSFTLEAEKVAGTQCWNLHSNAAAAKRALRDHSEHLITLESSARCRHRYESTGRSARYPRCEISLRDNVESRCLSVERNGSGASESLAQDFNGLSNFCGGGNKPDKRREADPE